MTFVLLAVMALSMGLVGATVSEDDRRRHEQAIRNAIRLAGMTMLRAAQEAEIDQAQLTRQIRLVEGTLKRLAMQPRAFWQWYAIELMSAFGLPAEARRAMRLALASVGLHRMARMSLPSTHQTVTLPLGGKKAQVG